MTPPMTHSEPAREAVARIELPSDRELPPLTDRGLLGQLMDAAWPHYGGNSQPPEFWYDFEEGLRFAAHYLASPAATSAPTQCGDGVLSTLNQMVTDYLTPATYKARFPSCNVPWHSDFPMPDMHHSEAGAHQVDLRRDQAFINDVIHLQDNPLGVKPREPATDALADALSPGSTGETEGWVLVPKEPSDGLLMSMAIRRDHGLGAPGYYDMLGEGEHEKRLRAAISEARQAHEEVVGSGFYSKERDADYRAMLSAAGER